MDIVKTTKDSKLPVYSHTEAYTLNNEPCLLCNQDLQWYVYHQLTMNSEAYWIPGRAKTVTLNEEEIEGGVLNYYRWLPFITELQ
jgi:hypothetical protein